MIARSSWLTSFDLGGPKEYLKTYVENSMF